MHRPVEETGEWLKSVMTGYYGYYAVPGSGQNLAAFRVEVLKRWKRILSRRSHKRKHTSAHFYKYIGERWVPRPRIRHPYPEERLIVMT